MTSTLAQLHAARETIEALRSEREAFHGEVAAKHKQVREMGIILAQVSAERDALRENIAYANDRIAALRKEIEQVGTERRLARAALTPILLALCGTDAAPEADARPIVIVVGGGVSTKARVP